MTHRGLSQSSVALEATMEVVVRSVSWSALQDDPDRGEPHEGDVLYKIQHSDASATVSIAWVGRFVP